MKTIKQFIKLNKSSAFSYFMSDRESAIRRLFKGVFGVKND